MQLGSQPRFEFRHTAEDFMFVADYRDHNFISRGRPSLGTHGCANSPTSAEGLIGYCRGSNLRGMGVEKRHNGLRLH